MVIFRLFEFFQLPARFLNRHDASSNTSPSHAPSCPQKTLSQATTPMYMPLEVVIQVLRHARDDADRAVSRQTLGNCALVCKDWSFISQELLFDDIVLKSDTAARRFMAATDSLSPRGRALAGYAKRMHCVLDNKQPHGLTQEAFTNAVQRCSNLDSVSIAFYGTRSANTLTSINGEGDRQMRSSPASFNANVLSVLQNGPRISALHFDNWSDDPEALSRLLQVMPSVTSLSIGGKTPLLPSPVGDPVPHALQELRLNFQHSPSTEFMKWLLHNSKESLRSLIFHRDPPASLLEYLILEHHATLETLALPACASQDRANLLALCSSLQDLRLERVWMAPGVRRELPPTLRRLAVAVDKDAALLPIIQAIKRSDALTAVTLHLWADGERHPQLPAMRIACARRGVQLTVIRDIRAFRTIECGYRLHGGTFCSTKSMK